MADSNRRHPRCKRGDTTTQSVTELEVTPTPSAACTAACTSKGENANADACQAGQLCEGEGIGQGDMLTALAAAIADLSPADGAKLAAMLVATQGEANTDSQQRRVNSGQKASVWASEKASA